jgi:hypothetical protein
MKTVKIYASVTSKTIRIMTMLDYFTLATYEFTYKNMPDPKCDTKQAIGMSHATAWIVMSLS